MLQSQCHETRHCLKIQGHQEMIGGVDLKVNPKIWLRMTALKQIKIKTLQCPRKMLALDKTLILKIKSISCLVSLKTKNRFSEKNLQVLPL